MTEQNIEELILAIDSFIEGLEDDYPIELIRDALLDYIDILDEVI